MILVRALSALARPALLGGTVAAVTAGGWFAYNSTQPNSTAFQRLQSQGQRLLVSEFGENADTIIAVNPDDLSDRETIATIDHAPEFGIFAALSPDGQAVAYTALPVDAARPAPDAPAHAAIVDTSGDVTLLANDIDLLIAPVWSPDSQSIVVRKNTPLEDDNGSFDLLLLGRDGSRSVITTWQSAAAFPIGFSPDGGTLYFATLNNDGTDLYRVAPDGSGESLIAHLSDQIARDWRLSPDGATLAYSATESGQHPTVVARTVDLATGLIADAVGAGGLEAGPPTTGIARAELSPAYAPDGGLTVASLKLDGGADAVSVSGDGVIAALSDNDDGLDLPLSWSPDGSTLVVRAVEGEVPFEAGASYVELVEPGGTRERVSENSDVQIVGWME